MQIGRDELAKFSRSVPPAPPAIEPILTPVEEAKLLAARRPSDPTVGARRQRVLSLLRRPAPPQGPDAELLVLLAASKALPLDDPADRLKARMRLVEVGRLQDPPAEVRVVMQRYGVAPGNGQAFADALLPPSRDTQPFHPGDNGMIAPPG